jgi:hypothetical protein
MQGTEAEVMHEAGSSPECDVAIQSVYYALFRTVELAEYSGPETAIEWAQSVLEERQLLHGFVERVRELCA